MRPVGWQTITGRELQDLATRQRHNARAELQTLADERRRHTATTASLRGELEEAWRALLEIALPDLEPAGLDGAAQQLALPALGAREVTRRMAERKAQLSAVIAQIDADPAMRERDATLAKLDIRRRGLDEQLEPLQGSLQKLEAEPDFADLIASGYGTETYARKWWQRGFFRHWKRADEVVAKHGPRLSAEDFGQVRGRYLREREAAQTFLQERAEIEAQAGHLVDLTERRRDAEAGLGELPAWALGAVRARLREHLHSLPDQERMPLYAGSRPLELAGKRVSGIEAKLRYFSAIGDEWLMRPQVDLQRRLEKIERLLAKLAASPRKLGQRYDRAEMEAKLGLPADRLRERRERYAESAHNIVVFQNYDAFDYMRDYLWWDLMTGGHTKASFIPEVSEYRAREHVSSDDATAALASSYSSAHDDHFTSSDAS
jgi:hypothetical protein